MSMRQHPCPTCNQIAYVNRKGDICGECRLALERGRKVIKEEERAAQAGQKRYLIPWAFYALPHIMHASGEDKHKLPGRDQPEDALDAFQWHFDQLASKIGIRGEKAWEGEALVPAERESSSSSNSFDSLTLRKDLAEHLRCLYTLAAAMVENAYEKGRENGENLLLKLASGDVPISQLNKLSIKSGS